MKKIDTGIIALMFFAILFGLAGVYALRVALKSDPVPPQLAPQKPATITVPMASRDISAGTTLVLDDVALFSMTRDQIRERVGQRVFMTQPDQIIGKTLKTDLATGSVFNTKNFYPEGRGPGISNRLQPGQRALTIRISPVNALIGFAGPGQKVDVLFHYGKGDSKKSLHQYDPAGYNPPLKQGFAGSGYDRGGYRNGQYNWGRDVENEFSDVDRELKFATSTIAQDVEILALGKNSTPTKTSTGLSAQERVSVTLAVNPRQAELIRVAEGHGELSLTLRGPSDSHTIPLLSPVTVNQIVTLRNNESKMEIFRGTTKSQLKFRGGKTIERKFHQVEPAPVSKVPAAVVPPPFIPVLAPQHGVTSYPPPQREWEPATVAVPGRQPERESRSKSEATRYPNHDNKNKAANHLQLMELK